MSATAIGVGGIIALFVLVALHLPLAFAMIVVGIVAFALQTDWGPALTFLASEPSQVLGSTDIAAVPLFLMMLFENSVSPFPLAIRPPDVLLTIVLQIALPGFPCMSAAARHVLP